MVFKEHTRCRVCDSPNMTPYLDLGMMPLSNNLASSSTDPIHGEKYPLKVLFCDECGLSQLSIVIEPEVMFKNYVYRSSISQGYIDHCNEMAVQLKEKYNLGKDSFHIDIAGNDGALLNEFKKVVGGKVLNVDPAENLAAICDALEIPTLTKFWGRQAALTILQQYGQADLITATNVFAHVDDISEFIQACELVLKPTGVLVMEFPYLIDFIENKEFDTIYFEHLSYFSIKPLNILCQKNCVKLMEVEKQEIHGGSVRVTIGFGPQGKSVRNFIRNEEEYYSSFHVYRKFAFNVMESIHNFYDCIYRLPGKVGAFAASAKGNTLLNSAGLTVGKIRYIVDETSEKIGKYSPGTFIPIISIEDMMKNPVDYLIILSWNFKDEIIRKCKKAGFKGKFIIPIPEIQIID